MGSSPPRRMMDRSILRPRQQEPYLSIHHFTIFVRDQDQSLKFYVDRLGFHLVVDTHLESGDRWVAVAPPDGTAILALVAPRADSEEYKLVGLARQVTLLAENVTAKFQCW